MKYPIGIQEFEKIRKGGFVYVDKTELVYELTQSGQYLFLSRPRRFGKSLLLSTIEAYFLGKKELFKGLAIESLEKEWIKYPVIHIDMNIGAYTSIEDLRHHLDYILSIYENEYAIDDTTLGLGQRFDRLIRMVHEKTGRNVVVLIDEYDKPLLSNIGDSRLQEQFQIILRSFYSVLKSSDKYIHFAMLTGVTKFGRLSVFSGLNNIRDISFTPQYATVCGITEEEVTSLFSSELDRMSSDYGLTYPEMVKKLRDMYDGYRFTRAKCMVYNPFSLLSALSEGILEPYWFETGTPKYLVDLLQLNHYEVSDLEGALANQSQLSVIDIESSDPVPIIFQSGYLTIKDFDINGNVYTLGFPNIEVREGFMQYLIPFYLNKKERQGHFDINKFRDEIKLGQAEAFMKRIKSLSADISYEILANCENDFHNMMYIIFMLVSSKPDIERQTSNGRIDIVVETTDFVYVMEFKVDGDAKEAIDQINGKDYALPWAYDDRVVIKIGANFSTEKRRLTDYIIEK